VGVWGRVERVRARLPGERDNDWPASPATHRDVINELTQRFEGLTAHREVLVAHLQRTARRGSHVPLVNETGGPDD
jgi:hypothetical protein